MCLHSNNNGVYCITFKDSISKKDEDRVTSITITELQSDFKKLMMFMTIHPFFKTPDRRVIEGCV